jgi:copper chaperone CopZ
MALVSLKKISDAYCDVKDVIEAIKRRKNFDCLKEVKKFLENLYPDTEHEEGFVKTKIEHLKLKTCLNELQIFLATIDQKTKKEPKDDEDSETTINDCLLNILAFLKSLT